MRAYEHRRVVLMPVLRPHKPMPNFSLNPDASPAALTRRPRGAG
jgi:hypothetical protein